MHIEPETEIVQSHFCGQASLKPGQLMGTFPSQTKGVQEFLVDRFDDLPNARQPAAQGFGPTRVFAHLMRWRHQLDLILLVPPTSWSLPRKPFVGHIRPVSRQSSAGHPWRRGVTSGKQGGSQVLIMRARTSKAKASNDSLDRDAQEEMEAFIPADAITPPDICLTSQPAQSAPLRITGHRSCAVEYFIGRVLRLQKLHQKQGEGGNCIPVGSLQPIELATIRQLRKRLSQVLVCIAGKRSLALKLHPLSKQRQRDHLTSAQRRLGAWSWPLWLKFRLAKIVYHNVQCSQEGIQIQHQRAPFLTNCFDKLTVRSGSLLFQVLSISHQTFKRERKSLMHWQFTPYAIPEAISGALLIWLVIVTWRRRSVSGASSFIVILLAAAIYSLSYMVELGSTDLSAAIFWNNVAWLGSVLLPPAWFAFALQYTGRASWLTRRMVVLLVIVPLVTLLLVWTNTLHGLISSNNSLDSTAPFSALVSTPGAWFWVFLVYAYTLFLLGALVIGSFIRTLMRSASLYHGQVIALLIAVIAPWVGNAIYLFGPRPLSLFDPTPLAFTVSGLAIAWSLFRYRMLDLAPVARNAVVEGMSDAVLVLDQRNRITDLNPAAQRILGHALSELIGQPAAQVFSAWPNLIERFRDATETHEEIILGEASHSFDLRISPLSDRRGSLTGRLIVLRDITERKQAEQAVRASEARKGVILQTALDAIVSIDQQSRIIEFNPAAEKMFGYKREEVLGQDMANLLVPASLREQHYSGVAHYLQTGKGPLIGKRVEVTATRADGTEFPVDLALADIPLAGPPVFTGYIRDITERKQAMEALEQARTAAEAANQAKSAFLAMMSHEIRTPMNAVIGMTGLLLDTGLSSEQREYAETVRSSSDALLTIINDILDFSKIEAGKLELERQPIELREVLDSALDLLAATATEASF